MAGIGAKRIKGPKALASKRAARASAEGRGRDHRPARRGRLGKVLSAVVK